MLNLAGVIFHVTDNCNLSCRYCYVTHLKKKIMNPEVVEVTLKKIADGIFLPGMQLKIIFHGGEPLIAGPKFFEEIGIIENRLGEMLKLNKSIQTNGTLINRKLVDVFKMHNYQLSISIDGPSGIHNLYRIDSSGRGSLETIIKNIHMLREHKIRYGTLCVYTERSIGKEKDIYSFLKEISPRGFRINPVVGEFIFSLTSQELYEMLTSFFDIWISDSEEYSVQPIEEITQAIIYGKTRSCNLSPLGCLKWIAIDPEGNIWPCNRFVGLKEFLYGNIFDIKHIDFICESEGYKRFIGLIKKIVSTSLDYPNIRGICSRCVYEHLYSNISDEQYFKVMDGFYKYVKRQLGKILKGRGTK